MKKAYLNSLKNKLNLSDELVDTVYELLEKVRLAGYVNNSGEMDLVDNLYENVDRVLVGTEFKDDFKTGYYDAYKKEIYIKDISNKKSVYQRFLYAMTTRKVDTNKYMVGYSYTSMNKNNYKLHHEGYGINRAVIANLASKLADSENTNIGFNLVYTKYKTNFLGYDIISENENYYFESNLFSQLCYALNLEKELFYEKLFSRTPIVEMEKELEKIDFDHKKYIELLDELSRKYSNYNKIKAYTNSLSSVQNKLRKLKEEEKNEFRKLTVEERRLKREISNTIAKYTKMPEDSIAKDDEINEQEILENLENMILNYVVSCQTMLSDYLCSIDATENAYDFASRLKQYNKMLIVKEDRIEKLIYEIITEKILKTNELTCVNLIEKIKYSLVQELISTDKYNGVYKDFSFKKISSLNEQNESYIVITSKGQFVQVVKVSDLDNRIQRLEDNTKIVVTDNFRHVLNSDYIQANVNKIEKIFTTLKEKYAYFSKITTENINFFEKENIYYLVMQFKNDVYVAKAELKDGDYNISMMELSENYYIFKEDFIKKESLLPVLYRGEENIFSFLFKKFRMIFAG